MHADEFEACFQQIMLTTGCLLSIRHVYLCTARQSVAVNKVLFQLGQKHMTSSIPETMTAISISQPGGPDVLVASSHPVPQPGSGQVLVKVAAAGVNRPDVVQRMGLYPPPPNASPLPGLEIAGEIVACGPDIEKPMQGQKVCALVNGGGYAEYCIAQATHCLPVPTNLRLEQAAAIPETLFTVWHNLFQRGYASDGDAVLVHGGTSGIGTMAILLGKLFGLTLIVTCGSQDKCEKARGVGADHAINYKTEDFVERVREVTGGAGVNVVLDMVAGDYVARNLNCLAEDGRHVTIAVQGGMKAELNMAQIMMRRLSLTGSTLRPRTDKFKGLLADDIFRNVWVHVENGDLRPVMDKCFALADAASAHRHMESGEHFGKIVLTMR